ncbi:glycosyltransferase family 2 protein [Candidatus Microgenomates bacterium]|nr:glycosyltransferase family 2 protein [Candidatus Microgenomates bacterium]
MEKVTIIIPVFNEEKVIGECLSSLAQQSYKNMEVIVVDDGSTDNTIKKCQILRKEHKGPGEARNLGASKAKGEILVFVDADMTFDKDFIKKLVEPILQGKTKGTWSREEYVVNPENIWSECWGINEGWEKGKRHPKNYPDKQKVFRAILASEFNLVGGFEKGGHYTDDWSLSQKLGYEAVAAEGAKFYHKNPENLTEVFLQAKWTAKRRYKLGILGILVGLIRILLPISLIVGLVKSFIYLKPQFLIFKLVYDLGVFVGILEYLLTGKGAK